MKKEDGFIVVEAMFIVTMTFLVLSILMGFAFIIYQQTNIGVMANDTAVKVASVYGYPQADPFTGYRSVDDLNVTPVYRYMFEDSSFFGLREPLHTSNLDKARWLSLAEMDNTAVIKAKEHDIDIEVINRSGMVGGSHVIKVNLSQTYDIPGKFPFQYFGIPDEVTFTATGTAVANDMMHRTNTVDTEIELLQYVEGNLFGLKTAVGVADAVKSLADCLTSWLKLAGS